MNVPSGDHAGSCPSALGTGAIALLPSAFVVQTCSSPLEKAILPPSGAQVGCSPGLAIVKGVSVEPSAATTKILRKALCSRSYASFVPSGDQVSSLIDP